MKLIDTPPPDYAFDYAKPPRSGNTINGLGERRRRRASKVFHATGGETLDWIDLDDYFGLKSPWSVVRQIIKNRWTVRRSVGSTARKRIAVDDPSAMSEQIKKTARANGAGIVGIARVSDDIFYEDAGPHYSFAVCIGIPMDRGRMKQVPHEEAAAEVMRTYGRNARTAVAVAEYIRALGWPARAYGNPNSVDILQIPLAIRAGLGQLGKHGSVISREYGSNFRLSAVLTDMPLEPDAPVDIGVDDLCVNCRRCTIDCPADAIFDEKQWVRGEKKWYVDFDRCVPYFVKTNGCAICIEVCPWSEPGRGPALSELLLAKRGRRQETEKRRRAAEQET